MHKIMDLKCPGSGESQRNRWSNLDHIGAGDEIKFVLADRADYEWMKDAIRARDLPARTKNLLASAVFGRLATKDPVAWVLADALPVRVQLAQSGQHQRLSHRTRFVYFARLRPFSVTETSMVGTVPGTA